MSPSPVDVEDLEVDLFLEALYRRYQQDFRHYARASIRRRLDAARAAMSCESLSMLQHRILHDPSALDRLLDFLTVHVSDLFRDPSFFRSLREDVVPMLRTWPSIKVWSAGCSTGEEAWSLAILLAEEGLLDRSLIYATDISEAALAIARKGVYDLDRASDFSRNHRASGGRSSLSDWYTAAYGGIVFDKRLRARITFSDHSLATDAVFSEVHLVTCRNVLIYFDRALQDRAIGLFRDALVRGGFLGLGSKETLRFSAHAEAFDVVDAEHRIYRRA